VLERLAQRNVYAITSFIFGMDNDTTGRGRAHAEDAVEEAHPEVKYGGSMPISRNL